MKIKQIRVSKKLTQEQLAREVNVKRTTVAMWESGINPRADKIPRIAEVLGCAVEDLFEENNPSVSAEPSQLPLGKGALGEVAGATSDTCEKADA